MLKGDAKTRYQREYMRRYRAKNGTDKPVTKPVTKHTEATASVEARIRQLARVIERLEAQLAERDREIAQMREQLKAKVAATPDPTRQELQDEIKRLRSEQDRLWRLNMESEENNRRLRMRKGLLTQSQFNHLRACLHTDSRKQISDAKLTQTRMAIEALEKVLVKP